MCVGLVDPCGHVGFMLIGTRFGTNTVFSPAVALSALGCGVLAQFCSSEYLLEGQINLLKLIAIMRSHLM